MREPQTAYSLEIDDLWRRVTLRGRRYLYR
jgi:hypothetical protein